MAYYQQQDFKAAIPFIKIIAETDFLHTQHAQWVLVLAYVQAGQLETAKSLLQKIVDEADHSYDEEAIKFLKELNGIKYKS